MLRLAVLSVCALSLAPLAGAQTIREKAEAKIKELTKELQTQSTAAQIAAMDGDKAMAAGDKATACTKYKVSASSTQTILRLLDEQRLQIPLAFQDIPEALARTNRVDENKAAYVTFAGQLKPRVTATCAD